MTKRTQTIRWQPSTNCLSVFDHFVGLGLKGLKDVILGFYSQKRVFLDEHNAASVLAAENLKSLNIFLIGEHFGEYF